MLLDSSIFSTLRESLLEAVCEYYQLPALECFLFFY